MAPVARGSAVAINERPEYYVFNGAVGGISKEHPLQAKVGETVRIYFGDGGPTEPVQRQAGQVSLRMQRRHTLRSAGDHQQRRGVGDAVEQQLSQL